MENENGEEWKTVGTSSVKRNANSPLSHEDNKRTNLEESSPPLALALTNENESTVVYIHGISKRATSIFPDIFDRDLQAKVGKVDRVVPLKGTGDILVVCTSLAQAINLTNITDLANTSVTCKRKTQKKLNYKKVVKNIEKGFEDDQLKKALSSQGVLEAKRFIKKKDGQEFKTRAVLLTMTTDKDELTLGYLKIKLENYNPPPIRCFGCNRWGHGISSCRSRLRCLRCGEAHEVQKCKLEKAVKCINCEGEHSAAYAGCPAAKKYKEIVEAKANNAKQAPKTKTENVVAEVDQATGKPLTGPSPKPPAERLNKIEETIKQISQKNDKLEQNSPTEKLNKMEEKLNKMEESLFLLTKKHDNLKQNIVVFMSYMLNIASQLQPGEKLRHSKIIEPAKILNLVDETMTASKLERKCTDLHTATLLPAALQFSSSQPIL